jgi:site-specific recombinase XerD
MGVAINTVKARGILKARRDPYWHRVAKGCYLGYRKMSSGAGGTWSARMLDDTTGKQHAHPLGGFSELPDHERYDAAMKSALEWFKHRGAGGAVEAITVGDACDRLVTKYRNENREDAAKDAEARFKRWIHSNKKLAGTPLLKLTAAMLADWRTKLTKTPAMHQDKAVVSDKPRAASTLNRDMAVLKTALNLAHEDGYSTSDHAWSSKLRPVKDASGRRECYLDITQRRALIAHAAPDLAVLVKAMSLLPMRPGAVAAFKVANFDKRLNALTIGKDKSGQDRKITLPASTAAFFAEQAKGKLPAAPLFSRAGGSAWNKDAWKYPFKDAVTSAKLPPAATAYALRHSTITDLIVQGLDTLTVSQLAGTSIVMIEKHYGHLRAEHATKALEGLEL